MQRTMQQGIQHEKLPQLNLVGNFDTQVNNIMQNIRLTREEVQNLHLLFFQLQKAMQWAWEGCKVVPFGSIVTGLGIKTSDVDCFIDIPEGAYDHGKEDVIIAREVLRRQSYYFLNAFAIKTAKVPIVKFYHLPTHRNCDVNFKSMAGVRNSELIAFFLHLDKRALPLAVLIKYWAKFHNLTGTNKVPNYGLTMMLIFYLQQKNILPPVTELQKDHPALVVDHWNTGFNENYIFKTVNFIAETENSQSLYELLGGFFKFYSTCNFDDNVLSPFTGTFIPRNLFNKLEDVPSEFCLYKDNVSNDLCEALKIDTKICIQDPFEHNRNCTISLFPRLAAQLMSHFQLAAEIYEETSIDLFIKDILARKPPPMPTKLMKRPKPRTPEDKARARYGKVTKHLKKAKKNMNGLLELYMNMNRIKKGSQS